MNTTVKTNMTMNFERITPEIAQAWLDSNPENRTISQGTVTAYANDMISGNWDDRIGDVISIDENGLLRNGQHRLSAIVASGVSINTWVCRNVASDGIYDNNRKRSASDQIQIMRDDLEAVYRSSRYISVARTIICHQDSSHIRTVTPKEIIDFTDNHKDDLDGYFLNINQSSIARLSVAPVHVALFLAYMGGVDIEVIADFYEILLTGMSTSSEEFPIIAYRNYLQSVVGSIHATDAEVARCQYSLKKYISKSCTRRSISPSSLIWEYPYS